MNRQFKNSPLTLLHSKHHTRSIVKLIILKEIYAVLSQMFYAPFPKSTQNAAEEYYLMDNKIICKLIHEIVASEAYTLQGIAHTTHLPLDVILDISCGSKLQFSLTVWIKIIDLYLQVYPTLWQKIKKYLLEKYLHDLENKPQPFSFTSLFIE